MNDLFQELKTEFHNEDYRYAYAQSFLNTKLASQIKTLREQRGMTQAKVAAEMKIKQPGYRRFEDVNHSVWKTDSLWNIARALGVRLDISFKTFGMLPEEKKRLDRESLQLPKFEDDPAFKEQPDEELAEIASRVSLEAAKVGKDLPWIGNSQEVAINAINAYIKQNLKKYSEALSGTSAYPPAQPIKKYLAGSSATTGELPALESEFGTPPNALNVGASDSTAVTDAVSVVRADKYGGLRLVPKREQVAQAINSSKEVGLQTNRKSVA